MTIVIAEAPPLLQICRELVTPGHERDFRAIEEDAARICVEMRCPNSHLAMESLTAPHEIWWLTPYASDADRERVAKGYAHNTELLAALGGIATRKQGVTAPPFDGSDVVACLNRTLTGGAGLTIAGARFFVAMATRRDAPAPAVVYESADGNRFVFRPVRDSGEGVVVAVSWGPDARVFAVRPYWGVPAAKWIAADPEFWSVNPAARCP
jgi:hypothetical protein